MMTLKQVLNEGGRQLAKAQIENYELDAWFLLSFYFGINRSRFYLDSEKTILDEQFEEYIQLIHKRGKHIPLQYIIGEQDFMGLTFQVSPDVLIPRQDTEILVEEVLKESNGKKVLDLCTGSGCIIISLSKLSCLKKAVGSDISPAALKIAKKNGMLNQVCVQWLCSDLFSEIEEKFDIIVSNPPYIETGEINNLMPEVRLFEPRIALDGKADGYYFYREIIKNASNSLEHNGVIYFEIGCNQGKKVKELLEENGFSDIIIKKDLSNFDRVVYGKRK